MAHEVFVSYTYGDGETADAIVNGLEAGGLLCWYSPRDLGIERDSATTVSRAISACKVFVLVLSGHSIRSAQVLQERSLAVKEKAIVIHFRVDDTLLEDIQEGHHWLDARKQSLDLVIDTLKEAIFRIIRQRVPSEPLESELVATKSKVNAADGADMIYIPPGEFIMGSDEVYYDRDGCNRLEGGAQTVVLDGYYIYKNLVTVAMFAKFCNDTNRPMPVTPKWGWDNEDYPIVNVSWDDADAYCQWACVELPTSMQWEKAARGTDGLRFPWGNDWDPARCWNHASAFAAGRPISVGSFPEGASPYGVLDMTGSVWQWCSDLLQTGYYKGKLRIMRGHPCYSGSDYDFLCAMRTAHEPGFTYYGLGFRCATSL